MTDKEQSTFYRPSWDEYLMAMAYLAASRSHDQRTNHGAVLCDEEHRIISIGYNGFPRGCNDTELPACGEDKYDAIIHAEENCLLNVNSRQNNISYTMYVTGFPCPRCFNKLIQFGVNNIYYGSVISKSVQKKHQKYVMELADYKNIKVRYCSVGLVFLRHFIPIRYADLEDISLAKMPHFAHKN